MSTFEVSLDILTREMPVATLARLLGITASSSSHDMGEPHPAGDAWRETVLRVPSPLPGTRPLVDHIERLLAEPFIPNLAAEASLPEDRRVLLNVGAFFSTATCTVELPAAVMGRLARLNIGISISTYPCSPK